MRYVLSQCVLTVIFSILSAPSLSYRSNLYGRQTTEVDVETQRPASAGQCIVHDDSPNECRLPGKGCEFRCDENACSSVLEKAREVCCCGNLCGNICACQLCERCEFDQQKRVCQTIREDRTCANRPFEPNECRFPGTWYLIGGKACKIDYKAGNCIVEEGLKCVNHGDGEYYDHIGLQYAPDDPNIIRYFDNNNTRIPGQANQQILNVENDGTLYQTYITGNKSSGNKSCISYPIQIDEEGGYALSLKAIDPEYNRPGQRLFSVYLNDVPLLPEVDLNKYTGGRNKGVEFIQHIVVMCTEDHTQKIILVKGHNKELNNFLINGAATLKYCYSSCENVPDPTYVMSSFCLVKFNDPASAGSIAGALVGSTNKTCGDSGEKEPPKCDGTDCTNDQDNCKCKKLGCECNRQEGKCESGSQDCTQEHIPPGECAREGFFYSSAGVICKNRGDSGYCEVEHVIKALNLNGHTEQHIGQGLIDNIPYSKDGPDDYNDPYQIRYPQTRPPYGLCKKEDLLPGVNERDMPLYTNYIHGAYAKRQKGKCMEYKVPISRDGSYQLLLSMYEPYYNEPNKRMFTVKLGGFEILNNVDLFSLNGACKATNVIANFCVRDHVQHVLASGYKQMNDISDGTILLELCYGSCHGLDPNFVMSAFSVYKMRENAVCKETPEPPTPSTTTIKTTTEKATTESPPETTAKTTTTTTSKPPPPPPPEKNSTTTSTTAGPDPTPDSTESPPPPPPPPPSPIEETTTEVVSPPKNSTDPPPPSPSAEPPSPVVTEEPPPSPTEGPPPSTTAEPSKENDTCSSIDDFEPCLCKNTSSCERDETTGKCVSSESCKSCSSFVGECRRAGSWYSDGGVICKNEIQLGNCKMPSFWGVTFNSAKYLKTIDRFDLFFNYEGGTSTGNDEITEGNGHRIYYTVPVPKGYDVDIDDNKDIYDLGGKMKVDSKSIYGKGVYGSSGCLEVKFPVFRDGNYELSVKLIDTEENENSSSDLYVNNLYIARFFRASQYTPNNRKNLPFGLDLNVHFRLRDNQQTIYLKGYPPQRMDSPNIIFKACPADCAQAYNLKAEWWIGGVSIGILSEEEPPAETCERHTDGHSIDRFTTCDCKLNEECEVDAVTGVCSKREDKTFGGCTQCNFGPEECRWPDTYYLDGGILCHQIEKMGDCSFTQHDIVAAINFNSNDSSVFDQTDSFGIRYQVHKEHTCGPDRYKNPNYTENDIYGREYIYILIPTSVGDEIRLHQFDKVVNLRNQTHWITGRWNNTYPQNLTHWVEKETELTKFTEFERLHLFGAHVYGGGDHDKDWVKYKCVKCRVDLKNNPDGAYQLGILTGDFHFDVPGMRLFSYKINDLPVVKEIDLVATGAGENKTYRPFLPMRLIIHFRVTHNGTQLHVKGFPPKKMNGTIDFGPCYGDCLGYKDGGNIPWNHWHLAAYYVIKFRGEDSMSAGGGSLIDKYKYDNL